MRSILSALAAATMIFGASSVEAQDAGPVADAPPRNLDDGSDFAAVGLAAVLLPDFEGSSDYGMTPAPGAVGRISRVNFLLAGNRFSADLITDGVGPGWDFQAGPLVVLNINRASIKNIDERVAALGSRGAALELGGYVGIGKIGVVTSEFDRLSATLSYRKGATGAHSGGILVPTVTYMTPLSTKAVASVFVSAERAERSFADAYFSVDAAGSAASGLPVFDARGGWKNWSIGGLGAVTLSGDLRRGLQLGGGVMYRRLMNDFGDSPITSIVGRRGQWLAAIGLGYSF